MRTIATHGPRAIVAAGAVLLIAASAALGTYFGFQVGAHYHWSLGLIFAGAGLGGELLKPFAMHAAFDALGRWNLLRACACLAVALVCVVYSLASELALSAGSRGDLAAERKASSDNAGGIKAARKRAEVELAALKPARPVAELEPIVAVAKSRCRVNVTLGSRETVCSKDPALLAEFGRSKRRAQLEAKIGAQDGKTTVAEKEADPLAAAVAFYLTAAGFKIEAKDLATWLYLVPVLFLEIGSAFGLIVASAATSGQTVAAAKVADAETVANSSATVARPVRPVFEQQPHRQRLPAGDGQFVLDALKVAGRPLSNNELAAAMGCHKGEATKRRRKVEHMLRTERAGREIRVSLAGLH